MITDKKDAQKYEFLLYWFVLTTDHRIAPAQTDRDRILNAYQASLSPAKFHEQMWLLTECCTHGSSDVSQDRGEGRILAIAVRKEIVT